MKIFVNDVARQQCIMRTILLYVVPFNTTKNSFSSPVSTSTNQYSEPCLLCALWTASAALDLSSKFSNREQFSLLPAHLTWLESPGQGSLLCFSCLSKKTDFKTRRAPSPPCEVCRALLCSVLRAKEGAAHSSSPLEKVKDISCSGRNQYGATWNSLSKKPIQLGKVNVWPREEILAGHFRACWMRADEPGHSSNGSLNGVASSSWLLSFPQGN